METAAQIEWGTKRAAVESADKFAVKKHLIVVAAAVVAVVYALLSALKLCLEPAIGRSGSIFLYLSISVCVCVCAWAASITRCHRVMLQ